MFTRLWEICGYENAQNEHNIQKYMCNIQSTESFTTLNE